ncbi:MAG: hypothetical protein QOE58_3306 [Actinomycetota bacterium]|jgi:hypothetical protein|nr:hypothetical protein [Actinomycetota bacterium]
MGDHREIVTADWAAGHQADVLVLTTNKTALLCIVSDHGSSLSGPRSADWYSGKVADSMDSLWDDGRPVDVRGRPSL